ncbi:MAG TPA: glycerol-3-phosphate 1-O-acyltransferase PlsB [Casimicrobiaceae bacterium]|nr:glycerol-3-phosphate 1-O-acyltransferase PlsB [Casimicrobiaceae bacterium]
MARRSELHPGKILIALLRRMLYAVIRTQVSPERADALGIDPAKPVCYVLEDRHLSSLLVLVEETARRSLPSPLAPPGPSFPGVDRAVFSVIINRNPLSARTTAPSATLAQMSAALLQDPALDVQLVPVTVLWGRAPGQQDSLIEALFADAWASVGPLRQLLIILVNGRRTRVSFNANISLARVIRGAPDAPTAARKTNRFLRFHFRRIRETAIGPDLSHRYNLIEAMIASAALQEAIVDEAQRLGIGIDEARNHARRFAWEIASDFSYPVVRAGELVLKQLWNRLYDEVVIHRSEELAAIAPGKGLVYLPNHRSHVDYLLLSYFINAMGLAPPHIAAGDNLDIPVVGPILRRGGAFFMRRSFKGEPLYAAVFREYLHAMIEKGFPIAYFIEGGRSRSGRTLSPKSGLLGMTVESFMREHPRPLLLVPVYFSYEKLLEGRTLVAELEGHPKRGESLLELIGVARHLKREYGSVHVSFGTPLDLDRFLDAEAPGWHTLRGEDRRDAARRLTPALAGEMARRINATVVINPINVFAMAIVASPRHALDERALEQQIDWLNAIESGCRYAEDTIKVAADPPTVIAEAIKLAFATRIAHPLGDIIKVPDSEVAALNYLRNNVLHAYALPALIASLLTGTRETTVEGVAEFAATAQPFLRAELMLRHSAEEAAIVSTRILDIFVELGLARRGSNAALRAPDRYSTEQAGLELLARSLRHLLRRNYLTIALLTQFGSGRLQRPRLEELMQMFTQRLSMLFEFAPPDFYERSTFGSYVDNLIDAGIIDADADGWLHLDERSRAWKRSVERLLPADALFAIRRVAALHGRAEASEGSDRDPASGTDGH